MMTERSPSAMFSLSNNLQVWALDVTRFCEQLSPFLHTFDISLPPPLFRSFSSFCCCLRPGSRSNYPLELMSAANFELEVECVWLFAMAAGACQMTSPKAAQSYRVALDHLPVRGGCRTAVSCASLGARCEAVATLGARLRVTGGHRWRHKSSSIPKFFVSAAVEEAVSASQADSGALAESLSMFFKVVLPCRIGWSMTFFLSCWSNWLLYGKKIGRGSHTPVVTVAK